MPPIAFKTSFVFTNQVTDEFLLGHVSVKTTEVYAKADARLKREAIEAASKEIVPPEEAAWDTDTDLREWLKSFNRH